MQSAENGVGGYLKTWSVMRLSPKISYGFQNVLKNDAAISILLVRVTADSAVVPTPTSRDAIYFYARWNYRYMLPRCGGGPPYIRSIESTRGGFSSRSDFKVFYNILKDFEIFKNTRLDCFLPRPGGPRRVLPPGKEDVRAVPAP